MEMPKITNQGVAVFAICCGVAITFGAFWLARADHDLKLMSLQAVLTLGGNLMGIAGTLLVGVAAYQKITGGDLPPGSSLRTSETAEVRTPAASPDSTNPTQPSAQ